MITALVLKTAARKAGSKIWDFLCDLDSWVFFVIAFVIALWIVHDYTERTTRAEVTSHYEGMIKEQDRLNDIALDAVRNGQDELFAELNKELNLLRGQKPKTLTLVKKVKEYVTEKSDAACTIPAGFVWLHDKTLEGENGVAPVSDRAPGDVDAASGVALSAVASTLGSNNAECVERGRILSLWQRWYPDAKRNYEQGKAIAERPH